MTSRPSPFPVLLCADDYGLAPGVNTAIRDLIAAGRLTATSAMTLCPYWAEGAEPLKAVAEGRADVGLHFTLTDQTPLGPMPRLAPNGRLPSLPTLMKITHTASPAERTAIRREVRDELARQLDAFAEAWGGAPAYIDGHQHVHQLPIVRGVVVEALEHRLPGAYLRLCREPVGSVLRRGVSVAKTLIIGRLGRGLARLAHRRGIPANDHFRGVYDFASTPPFGDRMARFLDRAAGRTLVMVHPGIPDEALRRADSLVDQRRLEHDYLAGPEFAALLVRLDLRLARFADLPGVS